MRPIRISFVGGLYHVTVRCNNREFFFRGTEDFEAFLKIMLRAKEIYNVQVFAYCLTNNHVHLLVATPEEPNLSQFMQYLNGNFAKAYNKRHGKTGRFWGGRFYSTVIESETQFFNTLFYIEFNLVRCQAVDDPADWKWSSYRAHALGEDNPVLDLHELYLALGPTPQERQEVYRQMADAYIEEKGLRKESVFVSGIILGSQSFVEGLLELLGRTIPFYRNRQSRGTEDGTYSLRACCPVPG